MKYSAGLKICAIGIVFYSLAWILLFDGGSINTLSYPADYKTPVSCRLLSEKDCAEFRDLTMNEKLSEIVNSNVNLSDYNVPTYAVQLTSIQNDIEDHEDPEVYYGDQITRLEVTCQYFLFKALESVAGGTEEEILSYLDDALRVENAISQLVGSIMLQGHYLKGRRALNQTVTIVAEARPEIAGRILKTDLWKKYAGRYFSNEFSRWLTIHMVYLDHALLEHGDPEFKKTFDKAKKLLFGQFSDDGVQLREIGLSELESIKDQDNIFIRAPFGTHWLLIEDYCQRQMTNLLLISLDYKSRNMNFPDLSNRKDSLGQQIHFDFTKKDLRSAFYYDFSSSIYGDYGRLMGKYPSENVPERLYLGGSSYRVYW